MINEYILDFILSATPGFHEVFTNNNHKAVNIMK